MIGAWLEERLLARITRRREERLMKRFGGIQRCPWCRQVAQSRDGWSCVPFAPHPTLDVLTCGVCGGTSLWLFALGYVPMTALQAPAPDPSFPRAHPEIAPIIEAMSAEHARTRES